MMSWIWVWKVGAGGTAVVHGVAGVSSLQATIRLCLAEQGFDVIEHVLGLAQGMDAGGAQLQEFGMRHGQHDGVVGICGRRLRHGLHAVFVFGFGRLNPGVVDVDLGVVAGQFPDDVDHLGVAHVGAAFLESEAQHQDARADDVDGLFQHQLDHLPGHVATHAVVDAPSCEDDFGVVADFLCLVGEVVRVHADAVAADEAGAERQEVPLGAGGFEDIEGIDAKAVEDQRQFVHQGNVEVALGVLDHLGGFGDLDGTGFVGAGGNDAAIQGIDEVRNLGSGAGSDLLDGGQAVLFVAGVDALWAVAGKEVAVELEAGVLFEDGDADFFGGAGIDGGFVDDDGALAHDLADGFGGLDQRGEVRAIGLIDGGGDGDDEDVAGFEVIRLGGIAELRGGGEILGLDFAGAVMAGPEFIDARLLDVKADDGQDPAEFDGKRQADVAEADDGNPGGSGFGHASFAFVFRASCSKALISALRFWYSARFAARYPCVSRRRSAMPVGVSR